jgi:hypothetical protein
VLKHLHSKGQIHARLHCLQTSQSPRVASTQTRMKKTSSMHDAITVHRIIQFSRAEQSNLETYTQSLDQPHDATEPKRHAYPNPSLSQNRYNLHSRIFQERNCMPSLDNVGFRHGDGFRSHPPLTNNGFRDQ